MTLWAEEIYEVLHRYNLSELFRAGAPARKNYADIRNIVIEHETAQWRAKIEKESKLAWYRKTNR